MINRQTDLSSEEKASIISEIDYPEVDNCPDLDSFTIVGGLSDTTGVKLIGKVIPITKDEKISRLPPFLVQKLREISMQRSILSKVLSQPSSKTQH